MATHALRYYFIHLLVCKFCTWNQVQLKILNENTFLIQKFYCLHYCIKHVSHSFCLMKFMTFSRLKLSFPVRILTIITIITTENWLFNVPEYKTMDLFQNIHVKYIRPDYCIKKDVTACWFFFTSYNYCPKRKIKSFSPSLWKKSPFYPGILCYEWYLRIYQA